MMWIWIGIGIWLLFGTTSFRMVRSSWRVKGYRWGFWDTLSFGGLILLGPIFLILAFCIEGKHCFGEQDIYWNEEEGQIKTKSGKCVFDGSKLRPDYLRTMMGIGGMNTELPTLQAQLQCAAKGHETWQFVESPRSHPTLTLPVFIYKCSNCGLEITKHKSELTEKELSSFKK